MFGAWEVVAGLAGLFPPPKNCDMFDGMLGAGLRGAIPGGLD